MSERPSAEAEPFSSPNTNVLFTAPAFGLPEAFDDPGKDLEFSGVFVVKDGEVILIDDSLAGPNGLAFSPDEQHLGSFPEVKEVWERRQVAAGSR